MKQVVGPSSLGGVPGAFLGEGMSLAAVVCPNGMGHFYRITGILAAVQARMPGLDISVIATPHSFETAINALNHIHQIPVELEPGVTWSNDPKVYADGRLINWEQRLADVEILQQADVVLSDNLGGVRALRPDAIMSGNFAWWDILSRSYPNDPNVAAFASRERKLMAGAPMLCVGALASPAVLTEMDAVQVGWMMYRPEAPPPKTSESARHIAVFGGATAAANRLLHKAVDRLLKDSRWVVHASPDLLRTLPAGMAKQQIVPLTPGFDSFQDCGVVVMRPGVGAMTAAVESGTPIVALSEPGNAEMRDNAERIVQLGIGLDIQSDPGKVVEAVTALTQPGDFAKTVSDNLRSQPRNGIAAAADFICNYIADKHDAGH